MEATREQEISSNTSRYREREITTLPRWVRDCVLAPWIFNGTDLLSADFTTNLVTFVTFQRLRMQIVNFTATTTMSRFKVCMFVRLTNGVKCYWRQKRPGEVLWMSELTFVRQLITFFRFYLLGISECGGLGDVHRSWQLSGWTPTLFPSLPLRSRVTHINYW